MPWTLDAGRWTLDAGRWTLDHWLVHPSARLAGSGGPRRVVHRHLPADRGGNLEHQIELDRRDEPRRLLQFLIELARSPARVAGEHDGAARKRVRLITRRSNSGDADRCRPAPISFERMPSNRCSLSIRARPARACQNPATMRLDRPADQERQVVRRVKFRRRRTASAARYPTGD